MLHIPPSVHHPPVPNANETSRMGQPSAAYEFIGIALSKQMFAYDRSNANAANDVVHGRFAQAFGLHSCYHLHYWSSIEWCRTVDKRVCVCVCRRVNKRTHLFCIQIGRPRLGSNIKLPVFVRRTGLLYSVETKLITAATIARDISFFTI